MDRRSPLSRKLFILAAFCVLASACQERSDPSTPAKPDVDVTLPEPPVTHELTATRWALVQLGLHGVVLGPDDREPFIALNGADHTVSGHAGCNRLMGEYREANGALAFEGVAATRMACAQLERETAFLQALESTASYKIEGAHLELFDANGATLAVLEAKNL